MYSTVANSKVRVMGEAVMDAPRPGESPSLCVTCPVRATGFCQIILDPVARIAQDKLLTQHWEQVPRRGLVLESANQSECHYAICEGWALRFKRFKDGRRHILNFLIPGDLIYTAFTECPGYSVQALTDVRYCRFSRTGIEEHMLANRATLDALIARGINERMQLAATAVALSRFDASGRIAHLVLHLRDRLAARGLVSGESSPFPLRQSHIADATGLTTVHVSRTIGAFRKDGIFAVEDGMLKIFDLAKLRRIGDG
jgi:CRP/FNR family transcriptional regulator